jgi:hypothetical protein
MKDDKMALPTGVTQRGGVYWLRVLIPDDLRHLYPRTSSGKLATDRYRASLRTSDKPEAKVRALTLRAEFEAEFHEKRKRLAPAAQKPSPTLVAMLAERIRHTILAGDDAGRYGLPAPDADPLVVLPTWTDPEPSVRLEDRRAFEDAVLRGLRQAAAEGSLNPGLWAAEAECKALGLRIDWAGQTAALVTLTRTVVQAFADAARRSAGEAIETPAEPVLAIEMAVDAKAPKYHTIRDLLPLWKQKTKAAENAVSRTERALDLLDDAGVNTALSKLTRSDGAQFRDWLRDSEIRPFGQKTGRNHYRTITALLNASLDYGALQVNPWQGLDFPVEDSEERPPFTRDELTRLYSGPVFESYAIPDLRGARLDGLKLRNCRLQSVNLSGASLTKSYIEHTAFLRVRPLCRASGLPSGSCGAPARPRVPQRHPNRCTPAHRRSGGAPPNRHRFHSGTPRRASRRLGGPPRTQAPPWGWGGLGETLALWGRREKAGTLAGLWNGEASASD